MSGFPHPKFVLVVLALLWAAPATADVPPEPAAPARLADRALMLGADRVGTGAVMVGDFGHVLRVAPGRAWTQASVPVRSLLTAVFFLGEILGWAVGHDAAIIHTRDGGLTWALQHWAPELEQPLFDVRFIDEMTGFAVGAYGLMLRSDDGGANWEEVDYTDDPDAHLNGITQLEDGTLVVVGERGAVYRSEDDGDSWEQADFPYQGSMFGVVVTDSGRIVTFGLRGRVFTSDDGGMDWTQVATTADTSLMGGCVLEDGRVVLVGGNGLILLSVDDGMSFTRFRHPDGDTLAGVVEAGGEIFVIGEGGMAFFDPEGSVPR